MKHACLSTLALGLGILLLATAAQGAILTAKPRTDLDLISKAQWNWFNAGYGQAGYWLTWNDVSADHQTLNFNPNSGPIQNYWAAGNTNPAWLTFNTTTGTGGGGGGGAPPGTQSYVISASQAKKFDFSILMFDKDFTDTEAVILFTGDNVTGDKLATLTTNEVNRGTMLTWNIDFSQQDVDDGVEVGLVISGAYAGGFFLDNVTNPEPATLAMLALGTGGLLALRRRRR